MGVFAVNMECMYVDFDQYGNVKYCPFDTEWAQMIKYNPSQTEYNRLKMFGESVCKFCLEGQKVDAMNNGK